MKRYIVAWRGVIGFAPFILAVASVSNKSDFVQLGCGKYKSYLIGVETSFLHAFYFGLW